MNTNNRPWHDPGFAESWFRLAAEAARGTAAAQEAFNSLMQASTPDEFARRMAQLTPQMLNSSMGSALNNGDGSVMQMWEEWWRMMGFVPRTRYLELLEENDALRRRLRAAEETIEELRSQQEATRNFQAGAQQASEQVQRTAQAWEGVFQQMLDAQSQWMQSWNSSENEPQTSPPPDAGAAEEPI